MPSKVFLISVSTALSLGYAAGFATSGFTSASTFDSSHTVTVKDEFDADSAVIESIWTTVDNFLCDKAEAESEALDTNDCHVEPGTVLSLTRGDALAVPPVKEQATVSFKFATSETLQQPQ